MTQRTFRILLLGIASAAWFAACQRAELSGPPALRLGHDVCAECGMMLSEDRCAGALLVNHDSERTHLVFDDIRCLLDYRADHPDAIVVSAFVRDYSVREWLPAAEAWFLSGGANPPSTPMGSGIVAFGTPEAAERQRAQSGGEVAKYAPLCEAHRQSREAKLSGR